MICPSDGVLCVCDRPDGLCPFEFEKPISPPPPTLADIERLVDALVDAAIYSDVPDAQEARATLMAAIRAYGRE